eukprot:6466258-Amphidinium_carterae.1
MEPRAKRARHADVDIDAGLLAAHPWLRSLGASSSNCATMLGGAHDDQTETLADTSEQKDDVMDSTDRETFHALRSALRTDHSGVAEGSIPDDSMFTVAILGGKWNLERTGRKLYGSRYDVRKDTPAHRCCVLHDMKLSASFDYHAHGEDVSARLARLYKAKVMHVTRHWLSTGSEAKLLSCPLFVLPDDLVPPEPAQKLSLRRWTEYLNMGPPVV